jgi:hypothetical protein
MIRYHQDMKSKVEEDSKYSVLKTPLKSINCPLSRALTSRLYSDLRSWTCSMLCDTFVLAVDRADALSRRDE